MDQNQESDTRVQLIELGPSTLDCLRRLTEAIERSMPVAVSNNLAEALPFTGTIPRLEKQSPYWDAKEAAAYLGTSVSSLYGLVERRQIEPLRGPRRRYRFTKELLDGYLKRGRGK